MDRDILERVTTIGLLFELMYAGRSRMVPVLESFEPIPVQDICSVLASRHGVQLGCTIEEWFSWFQSDEGFGSAEEKETLAVIMAFKSKTDPLFEQARKRNKKDK